jgi:predicted nucleic acid-binding protein
MLVDTSIWIDYFRNQDPVLSRLLNSENVSIHLMVIGELALGQFRNRSKVLTFLQDLPRIPVSTHEQVMAFVETHQLHGAGIGWVDAYLLTAVAQAAEQLWTRDKRLLTVAQSLNLAHSPV